VLLGHIQVLSVLPLVLHVLPVLIRLLVVLLVRIVPLGITVVHPVVPAVRLVLWVITLVQPDLPGVWLVVPGPMPRELHLLDAQVAHQENIPLWEHRHVHHVLQVTILTLVLINAHFAPLVIILRFLHLHAKLVLQAIIPPTLRPLNVQHVQWELTLHLLEPQLALLVQLESIHLVLVHQHALIVPLEHIVRLAHHPA